MIRSRFRDLLKTLGITVPVKRFTDISTPVPLKKCPPKGWTIHCDPSGHLEVWRK